MFFLHFFVRLHTDVLPDEKNCTYSRKTARYSLVLFVGNAQKEISGAFLSRYSIF